MNDNLPPVYKKEHKVLGRAVFSIGVTILVGVLGFLSIRWMAHLHP